MYGVSKLLTLLSHLSHASRLSMHAQLDSSMSTWMQQFLNNARKRKKITKRGKSLVNGLIPLLECDRRDLWHVM